MTELRRRLRKAGVEYVVIKNTLALRAVNESGLAGARLKGPTGIVVGQGSGGGGEGADRLREGERSEARGEGRHVRRRLDRCGAGEAARGACRRASRCSPSSARACRPRSAPCVGAMNGLLYMIAGALEALQDAARRRIIPRRTPDSHAPGYPGNTLGENYNG